MNSPLICADPECSKPVAQVGGYCKACIPARIRHDTAAMPTPGRTLFAPRDSNWSLLAQIAWWHLDGERPDED